MQTDRRRLLVRGAALLSASSTLSGCLGILGSSDDATEGESTGTRTTTRRTTPLDQHSDLWLKNGDSTARTVEVRVRGTANPDDALVDATYEVSAKTILEFSDLLRHDRECRIEATPREGMTAAKTLTAEGCAEDPMNSNGEKPVVAFDDDGGPSVSFKTCDVSYPGNHTRELAEDHEVSNATSRRRRTRQRRLRPREHRVESVESAERSLSKRSGQQD